MSLFHLHFQRLFSVGTESWVDGSFCPHFENVPLDSDLHGLWLKKKKSVIIWSHFSLTAINILFLCFRFSAVWLWYVWAWMSLGLLDLWVYTLHQVWGIWSHYSFNTFLARTLLFIFYIIFQAPELTLLLFRFLLNLFLKSCSDWTISNFYGPSFNFTASVISIQWVSLL